MYIFALLTFLGVVSAAPSSKRFPFRRIVAFGDNLSDNGNGSYAHCVAHYTECQNSIYGYRTWTNGPVAVSYLSGSLKIPLLDYAFGHANGGSLFGATIDNAYTKSTAGAPSSKEQIANYTAHTRGDVASSLHFLWIGANDINLYHILTFLPENHQFGDQFSALLGQQIQTLLRKGAKHIFVPNLYPKDLSNSVSFYASSPEEKKSLRDAIVYANKQIKATVKSLQKKNSQATIIYHDAFGVIDGMYNDRKALNFKYVSPDCCDGCGDQNFQRCLMQRHGDLYMWTQSLDPTTRVHSLLAQDMYRVLKKRYGVQ